MKTTPESYDEIKTLLNKLHDALYSADDTVKKRFIDNPNKTALHRDDLMTIIASLSKLESKVGVAKDTLVQELIRQSLISVK